MSMKPSNNQSPPPSDALDELMQSLGYDYDTDADSWLPKEDYWKTSQRWIGRKHAEAIAALLETERVRADEAVVHYLTALRAKADYMESGGIKLNVQVEVWNQLEARGCYELNDAYEKRKTQADKGGKS